MKLRRKGRRRRKEPGVYRDLWALFPSKLFRIPTAYGSPAIKLQSWTVSTLSELHI